jgi:hypothetical protein
VDLSIVDIILLSIVIWIVSQILLGVSDAFQIIKLTERVKLLKHLNNIIHQVKIETIGDIEYWYDKDTNNFLGQGKTLEEIISILKARFPDHLFLIEGKGGIAAKTDWKLMDPEEFQKHLNLINRKEV